ncbi:hypothetical protein [Frankia sp. AiPs1]|nr:hypothetical protein [Frankia sp. AiPs1]
MGLHLSQIAEADELLQRLHEDLVHVWTFVSDDAGDPRGDMTAA